jgi:antitoxin VapB
VTADAIHDMNWQDEPGLRVKTMEAALKIESKEASTLASELAELTGENVDTAVTTAIRERLERERDARDRRARLERVRALAAEIRQHMDHPLPSSDHSWLYDEVPR